MEKDIYECTIDCLPDEIISLILRNNESRDILQFSATCRKFNDMVKNDHILWREKLKEIGPMVIYKIVSKHCNGDWFEHLKMYIGMKNEIHKELINMSPLYYWRINDVTIEDVRIFFDIALKNSLSYFFTVHILQDVVKTGTKIIHTFTSVKPYTLTEMHYAKIVLRHLIHCYLALKWVKTHINTDLHPEIVVNFFLQWIDTGTIYPDDEVEITINELAEKVQLLLRDSAKNSTPRTDEPDTRVLYAISEVIYRHKNNSLALNQGANQLNMAATSNASPDTLWIPKAIRQKCGNSVLIGAVYQAVARKCGVVCNLVAFPNHLYLEYQSKPQPHQNPKAQPQMYIIDIPSGAIHQKRRCPFSQNTDNGTYKYCPDSLLQYLYSAFHVTMGAIRNGNTQNALHLLDFLGTNHNDQNPYRNFFPYLINMSNLEKLLDTPLDIHYLNKVHIEIISNLAYMNTPVLSPEKPREIKRHDTSVTYAVGKVQYAVGMVCYHKIYDYVCVIRGWDLRCAEEWQGRMSNNHLFFGYQQPFYNVVVADQSERYVAQENLVKIMRPIRLYHLEDLIAREFKHFNGFSYEPNDEKSSEYPDDAQMRKMYRTQAELKSS